MSYREAFPDYPEADFPAELPEGFTDSSWKNDACPSIESNSMLLRIWIDYADTARREHQNGQRYIVLGLEDDDGHPLLETDSWQEVLERIDMERAIQNAGIHVIEDSSPRGPMYHVMRGNYRVGIAYCRGDIDEIRERALFADVLAELSACDGAVLYWQTDKRRYEPALKAGVIKQDGELFVHPKAICVEPGMAYVMPKKES
jgi:hypothetical protein